MQLNAIDLFAGCGGLSLGLEEAGFKVELAADIDQSAAATYAENHPHVKMLHTDVQKIRPSYWRKLRGEIDLIAGGPPCQGFSVSGRRQYGEIPTSNTLVESFFDIVEIIRPRLVLLENVAGFRTALLKPGVKAWDFTISRLAELGYAVSAEVLQAADFGIPSLRSRLFIVGSLSDAVAFPRPIFGSKPTGLRPYISCLEAISDLPALKAGEGHEEMQGYLKGAQNAYQKELRRGSKGVFNHVAMRHTPRLVERFASIPQGSSSFLKEGAQTTVYKSNNQRLVASAPSLCITANFQSTYIHPLAHRNLTAREAARLMSFPDTYIFRGKRTLMSKKFLEKYGRLNEIGLSQYNQIGNSVPPRLATILGKALLKSVGRKALAA